MGTWPEARAAKQERQVREHAAHARSVLMRRGPACPRCGGATMARLVETTGDLTHPGCYRVGEEPAPDTLRVDDRL